jgi:hypothetical protein
MIKKTSSPKGGKKACLCDDGKTYSKECCEGKLQNQGIGTLQNQSENNVNNINQVRTITSE